MLMMNVIDNTNITKRKSRPRRRVYKHEYRNRCHVISAGNSSIFRKLDYASAFFGRLQGNKTQQQSDKDIKL